MSNIHQNEVVQLKHGQRRIAAIGAAIFMWPVALMLISLAISPTSGDIAIVFALPFLASFLVGGVMCALTLIRSFYEIRLIKRHSYLGSVQHRWQTAAISCSPFLVMAVATWLIYGQHFIFA